MHRHNRHQGHYDFAALIAQTPALANYVRQTPRGDSSIDFADPLAVRVLNQALLRTLYGVRHWILPEGYLCPPVPGRADYLYGLAELLEQDAGSPLTPAHRQSSQVARSAIGKNDLIRALDVGVGANCIYPLLGQSAFGWQFVGSDIDAGALAIAQQHIDANGLADKISLRLQNNRGQIFSGILQANEQFFFSICNPPFHASAKEAVQARKQKWAGLGMSAGAQQALNFGGFDHELWCTGGEASFVKRMIRESADFGAQVRWFSSLISRAEHLPDVYKHLKKAGAIAVHTVPMAQGAKQSRFVAWRFVS
jgi:23S rRNA (adenine1618-N6)-methyltransferase